MMTALRSALFALAICFCQLPSWTDARGVETIDCSTNVMKVIIPLEASGELAYLDQLKDYGVCAPSMEDGAAVFRLDLNDIHKCGVTRILHQPTGNRIFYHKIVVEDESNRVVLPVRCSMGPVGSHHLHRREIVFPTEFQEPEDLQIRGTLTFKAPEPRLGVAVIQDGKEVTGEISVKPGKLLAMKVFLDDESAPVYGLMVSHLQVSDMVAQQETIVFNGCSIDPNLFDNFVTSNGDTLEAKFRAFKFPDTTYVQFKGTVNVCLDKCQGALCSNGAVGYGRRRRSLLEESETNRLYEISLTTFIKVGNDSDDVRILYNSKKNGPSFDESSLSISNGKDTTPKVSERITVNCATNNMSVIVPLENIKDKVYLDQLKDYKACSPTLENGAAVFKLDLNDIHRCGITRILHQPTGRRIYYHKVIVEGKSGKEIIPVRCSMGPKNIFHQIRRRDADLPFGFQEPENLEIMKNLTFEAPEPQLAVAVSQNGKEVSGEISVKPGTLLSMRIYLDKESAPVYGLMCSNLQVSDTVTQQENLVLNGCSVDPSIFNNFITTDGDSLEAKFRAFKFPDTTYVQFRGTVNVCLDKCEGMQCNNGVIGYGRKRRSISEENKHNRLFEISLTTFIKVENYSNEADDSKWLKNLKIENHKLEGSTPLLTRENDSGEITADVHEKPKNLLITAVNTANCGFHESKPTVLIVAILLHNLLKWFTRIQS